MDLTISDETLQGLLRIRRLAFKHNRVAEMSCNGEGYVGGRFWRLDNPKAYTIQGGVEVNVFDIESDRIEAKICKVAEQFNISTDFQGDPRGYTVRLQIAGRDVSHIVLE